MNSKKMCQRNIEKYQRIEISSNCICNPAAGLQVQIIIDGIDGFLNATMSVNGKLDHWCFLNFGSLIISWDSIQRESNLKILLREINSNFKKLTFRLLGCEAAKLRIDENGRFFCYF